MFYASAPAFFLTRLLCAAFLWDATLWLVGGGSLLVIFYVSTLSQASYYTSVRKGKVVGILHPHCDQRAGGEMVLWSLVSVLLSTPVLRDVRIVIYTNALPADFASPPGAAPDVSSGSAETDSKGQDQGAPGQAEQAEKGQEDDLEPEENRAQKAMQARHARAILAQASEVFALDVLNSKAAAERIRFEFLNQSELLDAKYYPSLTMIAQAVGSALVGFEILEQINAVGSLFHSKVVQEDEDRRANKGAAAADAAAATAASGAGLDKAAAAAKKRDEEIVRDMQWLPSVMIDTAGYPFAQAVLGLTSLPQAAYVHYPVITHNMIDLVQSRTSEYNNSAAVARSPLLTYAKLAYYRCFAMLLRATWAPGLTLVNSTWTLRELCKILRIKLPAEAAAGPAPLGTVSTPTAAASSSSTSSSSTSSSSSASDARSAAEAYAAQVPSFRTNSPRSAVFCVYPPCKVSVSGENKVSSPREAKSSGPASPANLPGPAPTRARSPLFLSLGQFRPEKNQALQIEAFALALTRLGKSSVGGEPIRLTLVGTLRESDVELKRGLEALVAAKGLEKHVAFLTNVPRAELNALLGRALGGLHCMRDEHFGIGIVEMVDAGLATIAHRSGGPEADIIVPAAPAAGAVGYLCATADEYADAMADVIAKFERALRADEAPTVDDFVDVAKEDAEAADGDGAGSAAAAAAAADPDPLATMRANGQARMRRLFSEDCFRQSVGESLVPWLARTLLSEQVKKLEAKGAL